jgi:hypothetical protein
MVNITKLEDLKKENKPQYIRLLLGINGFPTLVSFAEHLRVTPELISMVIRRKATSKPVQMAIADVCGVPYEELWDSKPRRRAA